MFLGLSKTNKIKLNDIIHVGYDENTDESIFHLSDNTYHVVKGKTHHDVFTNFLILSRNLLDMQDLIDRQDKVDKALEFHLSDSNNNPEIIVALDNVEELIKKVKEAKKRSIPKQMDLFDSIDVDILN